MDASGKSVIGKSIKGIFILFLGKIFAIIFITFILKLINFCLLFVSGTISKGAALLHQEGAREVYACCTHAVFRYILHL